MLEYRDRQPRKSPMSIMMAQPPGSPGPWSKNLPGGIPFPLQMTLQGVIPQSTTGVFANNFAITNAIGLLVN